MSDIFTVRVVGTTDLDIKSPMLNVIVRISIVNSVTGEILPKSNREVACISAFEVSEYVPPVATKGVKIDNLGNLSPQWNESFLFNETLSTIQTADVLLFFEILETCVHPDRHGFTPISWAFLRLRSPQDDAKIGHPILLQLHYYPSHNFDTTIRGSRVPVATLMLNRRKCSARMTVQVDREAAVTENYDLTGRCANFFQKETSREPLAKIIERPDDSEVAADADKPPEEQKIEKLKKKKERREIRRANRHCVVPKSLAAQIPAGERGALAMQFSKNGDVLGVALQVVKDYEIQLFNVDGFHRFATMRAHVDLIYELQWSCDDRLLLSASADGMVKIWEGEKLKSTLSHPTYVYSGKFHPQQERLVVTAGMDATIRVWDRVDPLVISELVGHEARVNSLTFSPDGKNLFSGDANGVIIVWNTDLDPNGVDGFSRTKIVKEGEITRVPITHLEMGKSNFSLLVHTRDSMVRIFDTKVMVPSQRYNGVVCRKYQMMSTFSPDGQYILAGSEDGSVVLWTVRRGEQVPVKEWTCKFDTAVTAVAWNRVENMVAFSSFGDAQPILIFRDEETRNAQVDDPDLF
jgi:jouberin